MVAEAYRSRFAPYISRIARPFLGWRPSRISVLALVLAFVAGALEVAVRFTSPLLFLPVAALILASGIFDVVDGEVARTTRRDSVRGDFLDHVFDRYADVAILAGLAVSTFAQPVLTLAALVSLLLASYMGTQAQAVGAGRLYSGPLGRADRLLLLAAVTFLEFDLSLPWPWAPSAPWSQFLVGGVALTVIDAAMVYFVIAGQVTAVQRAVAVYRKLPPAA